MSSFTTTVYDKMDMYALHEQLWTMFIRTESETIASEVLDKVFALLDQYNRTNREHYRFLKKRVALAEARANWDAKPETMPDVVTDFHRAEEEKQAILDTFLVPARDFLNKYC